MSELVSGFRQTKKATKAEIEAENKKLVKENAAMQSQLQTVLETLKSMQLGFTRLTQLTVQNQQNIEFVHKTLKRETENQSRNILLNQKYTDAQAELGDTVIIDFVGQLKNEDGSLGSPFNGGLAFNFALELGSKRFVPGFEEQLVGIKAGELREVTITFPENYSIDANLASKTAQFSIMAKAIMVSSSKDNTIETLANKLIEEAKQSQSIEETKAE